MLNPSDPLSID